MQSSMSLWKECLKLLHKHGLRSFKLRDSKCGGATDAELLFGLGSAPGFGVLPSNDNTVERALPHFLDGGTDIPTNITGVDLDVPGNIIWSSDKTFIPVVDLPALDHPPRKVIWASDKIVGSSPIWNTKTFVRQEGLFPTRRPQVLVACPSHYRPKELILRPLAMKETLRLYQIPLHMDAVLIKDLSVKGLFV